MLKTERRFFTIADYEDEEIWLREQHRKGWKLVKMKLPCFYYFESCKPQDVIYRLDYKNYAQTPEYLQMLDDFGWEYFTQCSGWLYFRKPADAAESEGEEELFSDDASRVDMVGKIVRTRLIPLAVIFLCCVIPGLINAANGVMGGFSVFFGLFFGLMFGFYLWLILYCGFKLKRIREKYQR